VPCQFFAFEKVADCQRGVVEIGSMERPAAPAAATMRMRRFQLVRDEDETGTSGPGLVAEGCEFTSGACAVTWLSPFKTVSMWDNVKAVDVVHGHVGKTRVVWVDP